MFHSAEPELFGPRRTEVETEIVSAVRARESRLARGRCELRWRVPHEDAVSVASKLAQWVEQRSGNRGSWVRIPCLHQPVKLAPKSAGLRSRIEVPQQRCRLSAAAREGEAAEKHQLQRALRHAR